MMRRARSRIVCARNRLDDVVGQDHLLGEEGFLGAMVRAREPRFNDILGTARVWQNDGCQITCP